MSSDTVKMFKDGVLQIADNGGVAGSNKITMKIGNGGLRYTSNVPRVAHKNRGTLDHWRDGEDEPMEWSIEGEFRGYESTSGTDIEVTPYEALTGTGEASSWVSNSSNTDTYSVQIVLTITDPGDATTEIITLTQSVCETEDFAEVKEGDTLTFSGRALTVRPTFT